MRVGSEMGASRWQSWLSGILVLALLAGATHASGQDAGDAADEAGQAADEAAGEAAEDAGGVPPPPDDVEEFLVVAPPLQEILAASRMDADELINTLDAGEIAKFAASDIADALKFVPGVSVQEGQFAIIRGLEDRYSSTLYNRAPIPSPDPDRQSPQLDLFASDVVTNLIVAKTFAPELPGNSSGGSIDIVTQDYPEALELRVSSGLGGESRAWDRFLRYNNGSPIGVEEDGWHVLEREFGMSFGGPVDVLNRRVAFKGVLNREIDYRTGEGWQESREPIFRTEDRRTGRITRSGDLSLGELSLSEGRFDLTESERSEQDTGYFGLGFDVDEAANHRIDGSIFYTKKKTESVELQENGYLPNFDYDTLVAFGDTLPEAATIFEEFSTRGSWISRSIRTQVGDPPSRGPAWFSNFQESRSFKNDRDLQVYQVNGDHVIEPLPGLRFQWALNHAKTSQTDEATGTRVFFEPDDLSQRPTSLPVEDGDLGPGQYAAPSGGILLSSNDIDESQDFGRLDAEYERELHEQVTVTLTSGAWYEHAERDVASEFLEGPIVGGSSQFAILDDDLFSLGNNLFDAIDPESPLRETTNESERKIRDWYVGGKATFWDRFDVTGGIRRSNIYIESNNDPFTGEERFGGPATFPEAYLFFDRLDNPARGETTFTPGPDTIWNDELLGIDVPIDPVTGLVDLTTEEEISALANGLIEKKKILPSVGFNYRPIEGLAIRGAFSETVARPSFRELGFYVSVEPGTDDLTVGNPQLQISEVRSWDGRVEYTWGGFGDLAAVSLFYKTIADPIESILLRNPLNFEQSGQFFRTFFNNPNEATLLGVELEGRKNLGFIGPEFLEYFTIGGNFTYIDAEVDRTEAELDRAQAFFGVEDGVEERYDGLEKSRRLFGQPEWIANADLSFDHPDWGTKATLVFFAISDVLDAAGSVIGTETSTPALTLDRYVDSFYQLDFVFSQRLWRGLVFKASVKNLTDSKRRILYDPEQTRDEEVEQELQIGRDYSFSLSYTFEF